MIRVRRLKVAAIFSLIVGLAVMIGIVSARSWISLGDGTISFQVEQVCKDGFGVLSARVTGDPNAPPSSPPYNLSFYARMYPFQIDEGAPDQMAFIGPGEIGYVPPTPILAEGTVVLNTQSTPVNVTDLNGGFDGTTYVWGRSITPWTGTLDPAYPYIDIFPHVGDPQQTRAFGVLAYPAEIQNCYLFPPDAKDDRFSTRKNTALRISFNLVLANDTDPNGNPFSIVSYTVPRHGRVIQTSPTTGWYIPNVGFVGTDTATYTIKDSTGATDTATITIDVRP